jgi:CopA family copper-resistance protein
MRIVSQTARALALGLTAAACLAGTVSAGEYHLSVDKITIDTGEFTRSGVGFNGTSPGPELRFQEGEDVVIHVTNNLSETTSIHWHGLILPYQQDGVPGITYDGIAPGETFTYRFPIKQSGTYWYHSHSDFQEPDGAYGALILDPKAPEPYSYDREYVVQLADAHPHHGSRIMRNLKMMPDYYNRKQRTLLDFFSDAKDKGLGAAWSDRKNWGEMRMMPTDIEDLQGFTPVINGKGPAQNWTGLFKPGERVRLRFINSSAMTYFDVRIPGLQMTVVQADGNNVQPVVVDEFRIAVAETYDVIVQPQEDKAYTVFAESMGRTAYASGTLAPRDGMVGAIPGMRTAPLLTMADMGGAHGGHGGMDHSQHGAMADAKPAEMDHSKMDHAQHGAMADAKPAEMDHSKMGHSQNQAEAPPNPYYADGSGLSPTAANGGKFLHYGDLKAQKPLYPVRAPTREIEMRLTGNMERYMWSINGIKYADADPIRLQYGERVRFKFVNETMMTHPMHLHGMWSILDTGQGQWNPIKHVVSVSPGTTIYMETEVDAPGKWAFHCHLSYHADSGMFRKVIVEGGPSDKQAAMPTAATGG